MTRKLRSVFGVYLAEMLAYPGAAWIWVLADVQSALVLPFVWLAAGGLPGYDSGTLVAYYLASMTVAQFTVCHLMWDIGMDVREGAVSAHLLRPIPYFWATAARNMSWRVGKTVLFLPVLAVVGLAYGWPAGVRLDFGPAFLLSLALAHTVSFLAAYCLAMVTFWTTEFVSVFRLFYVPESLLSGRIVPLAAFPLWAQGLADWTHFKYTIAFPVDLLLGRLGPEEAVGGFGMQLAWIVVFGVLASVLFRAGTRRYTGVGM